MSNSDRYRSGPENYGETYDLQIEPARSWQDIDCPACPHTFKELILPGGMVGGAFCPECWAEIVFVTDEAESPEDHTEQTLLTDGGNSDREQIGVPVGEVADTRPVTDHQSKTVMLRAERKDTILIDDSFTAEVVERQNGYYGPRLTLWSEERGKNYKLHGLSFDSGLLLWESVTNEDGFRTGWRKVGEVSAEIAATKPYEICQHCELPIRSLQHERFSALGLCERMEKPNDWGKGTGEETDTYNTGSDRDDDLRTDGGDDVCPECGDPVSGLVIGGPGDVTAQPCGHPARSLLQESMDTVRPDGGGYVG